MLRRVSHGLFALATAVSLVCAWRRSCCGCGATGGGTPPSTRCRTGTCRSLPRRGAVVFQGAAGFGDGDDFDFPTGLRSGRLPRVFGGDGDDEADMPAWLLHSAQDVTPSWLSSTGVAILRGRAIPPTPGRSSVTASASRSATGWAASHYSRVSWDSVSSTSLGGTGTT